MKERILEFLKLENKTSAQFADEIGVQPSGISHIISGRNNPSLDFILKMLEKYAYLSTDWLLFGRGSMYREQKYATLFDVMEKSDSEKMIVRSESITSGSDKSGIIPAKEGEKKTSDVVTNVPGIKKIVWFYEDKSFEEFNIRKV